MSNSQRNEGLCVVNSEFPECKVAEWERGLSRRAFHSPTYSFKPVMLHLDCHIDEMLCFYSLQSDSYKTGRGYPLSPHPLLTFPKVEMKVDGVALG